MVKNLNIDTEVVGAFCDSNQIHKLSLFGSVLRDDFHAGSDVDILVEFVPDSRVGYLDLMRMQRDLTGILGRQVDLRTPAEIGKHIRERVFGEAVPVYNQVEAAF